MWKEIISNKLLMPEGDRITRLSFPSWFGNLENDIQDIPAQGLKNIEKWVYIGNQISLLWVYQNDFNKAFNCCYRLIEYYYKLHNIYPGKNYESHIIQPWVNIGRLHRFNKNYQHSFDALMSLRNGEHYKSEVIRKLPILTTQLDNKSIFFIKNITAIEILKCALSSDNGLEAIKIKNESSSNKFLKPFLTEFEIIALIKSKKLEAALQLIENCLRSSTITSYLHILQLRKAQICCVMGSIDLVREASQFVYDFLVEFMNNYEPEINMMMFMLEYSKFLFRIGDRDQAFFFIEKSLIGFEYLKDELGIFESLKLKNTIQQGTSTSDKLQLLVKDTGYYFLRSDKRTPEKYTQKLSSLSEHFFHNIKKYHAI